MMLDYHIQTEGATITSRERTEGSLDLYTAVQLQLMIALWRNSFHNLQVNHKL